MTKPAPPQIELYARAIAHGGVFTLLCCARQLLIPAQAR
jgi:hypothetical protein